MVFPIDRPDLGVPTADAFDPARQSRYHGDRKLTRRCCKHPGPWRHLIKQVMRDNCTTRRPAPDRRRVFLVSENVKGGGHGEKHL